MYIASYICKRFIYKRFNRDNLYQFWTDSASKPENSMSNWYRFVMTCFWGYLYEALMLCFRVKDCNKPILSWSITTNNQLLSDGSQTLLALRRGGAPTQVRLLCRFADVIYKISVFFYFLCYYIRSVSYFFQSQNIIFNSSHHHIFAFAKRRSQRVEIT